MKTPYILGLTGSIGMGKSTTSKMFAEAGVAVWDADHVVHELYGRGGAAVPRVRALCPDCIVDDAVDRDRLKSWISGSPDRLMALESVVHELVADDRRHFIETTTDPIVLLDIPLLYEIGADTICDAVVVVTAPEHVQRARVLARPGMTEGYLNEILARQMPDAEKRKRADYLIETRSLEGARRRAQDILKEIEGREHAGNRSGHRDDRLRP